MKKDILICSTTKTIVQSEALSTELSPFETLILENEQIISVFPAHSVTNAFSLPFSLNVTETINANKNSNIKVVRSPHFDRIIIKPKLISNNPLPIYEKTFGTKTVMLSGYPHTLCIFDNCKRNTYTFEHEFLDFDISDTPIATQMYAKQTNGEEIFVEIFNDGKILQKSGAIVKENTKITCVSSVKNYSKHGYVSVFTLDSNEPIKDELIYEKGEPKLAKNVKIIPLVFIESIKVGDYELARKYLCDKLSQALDNAHLSKFFGKINNYYVNPNGTITIENNLTAQDYVFQMYDNKITNINEME